MSIEQTNKIDFVTFDRDSGDVWLSISDHLSWVQDKSDHLLLLQDKLNAYLRFIESGELLRTIPDAGNRQVVIDVVGVFPLSREAEVFYTRARAAIQAAGYKLQFRVLKAGEA